MRPETLRRIEAAHRYGAFYGDGFANHLPMALVALDAMDARDAGLARFASRYERRLAPIAETRLAIADGEESRHLSSAQAFPAWVAYFARHLAADGRDEVLAEWCERLAPGIGTAAFHGAIRTAYALESGSEREMAHALAYWAAAFEPLPAPAHAAGRETPFEVLREIARDPAYAGVRPPGRGIAERIAVAIARPGFASFVARVDRGALDLEAVAGALIRAYSASGDFTLLHGVTGCHALRLLLGYFPRPEAALVRMWSALVAAYMSCGSPGVEGWGLQGGDALDWADIHRRAAACDDEHDVKLAYSCWREWQWRRDDLYRRAASARVWNASAMGPKARRAMGALG